MVRRAVMGSAVIPSLQTPQMTFSALERAHLDRCLDVACHLIEVALKRAYACVRIREAGRVDNDPGLDSGNSMLHQTIKILTKSCHPFVFAGLAALDISRPRCLKSVQNLIWVFDRVLAVVVGVNVIMRLPT
jgi:hypothetical protein